MHNKIQQWGQMYTLGADGSVNKTTKLIAYLPAHKLEQIERWRKDVKKNAKKSRSATSQHHNWSYSANPKTEKRIISADGSLRKIPQVNGMRVTSANNIKHYNRTDLFSVTNHLTETSLHYAAQRESLHRENTSNGRSIPIHTYEQSHNGTVPYNDTGDLTAQVNGELSHTDKGVTIQHDTTSNKDLIHDQKSDKVNNGGGDETEILSNNSNSDMANTGHSLLGKDQVQISNRSTSNQLLNIISIDDCKRSGMYRFRRNLENEYESEKYAETIPEDATTNIGENKSMISGHDSKMSKMSQSHHDKKDMRTDTKLSRKIHFDGTNMTTKSGFSDQHHKARISNAIDHIINDRKVMNDMDKNFDVRIESVTGRIVLERTKESKRFKKMNTALRQHIDNLITDQGRRVTKKHYEHKNGSSFVAGPNGMNKLTEKITSLADSLTKGVRYSNEDNDDGIDRLKEKLDSLSKSVENEDYREKLPDSNRNDGKRDSLTNSVTLPAMSETQELESVYAKPESPTYFTKHNDKDTDILSQEKTDDSFDEENSWPPEH